MVAAAGTADFRGSALAQARCAINVPTVGSADEHLFSWPATGLVPPGTDVTGSAHAVKSSNAAICPDTTRKLEMVFII